MVPLVLLALTLAGGSNLLLRLFFLSVLVLLVSYLWARLGIGGLRAQVGKPPDHCQVGEWFNEEVTVFNGSRIPKLWLRLEENTDLPGHHNVAAINLSPGSSHHWLNEVYCRRRGQYRLGSITATATDPFGLFPQHRSLGEPQPILIYPATLELPFFESLSLNDFGYSSGQRSISQISPNASSVREYIPGDSLSHIHWHSTAHTGDLMVKVFDADRSRNSSESVWIIVDMCQTAHAGEGEETTEEYGITIAASLIKKYLDGGMRVGLAASGDQSYLFPPERGEQHSWRMLEALALMQATGQVPIDQLIADEVEHFKGTALAIVITPSDTEPVVAAIRQLKNRGNLAAAVLLDAASFGGTINSVHTARSLSATGTQVYIVRQGDELARVLDSRLSPAYTRFI